MGLYPLGILIYVLFFIRITAAATETAAVPAARTEAGSPASNQMLILQVALPMSNLDHLESKLTAISSPDSASYGQHLDLADANALFAPSKASETAVLVWLKEAGVSQATTDGHLVTFTATVGTANRLLSADFKTYTNGNGTAKVRTTQYSVPDGIASHVDFITPTTYFGTSTANAAIPAKLTGVSQEQMNSLLKRATVPPQCTLSYTRDGVTRNGTGLGPDCLKLIYSVGNYAPDPKSGSTIGFGSFLNQSASYADLSQFETMFGIAQQSFNVTLISGGVNNQTTTASNADEANLDVQYIVGLSHPLPVTEFITGGSPPFIPNLDEPTAADNENEPYVPYYQYLLSQTNADLPKVITNSYGDDEQTVPSKYAARVCNMTGILGIRGISVLESSGDTGVGAACRANDGSNTQQFTPTFPGTCPYITAVGGTQFGDATQSSLEVAWTASSGGFSNYFPRPWYQQLSVSDYFLNHVSAATKTYYKPYYNENGRGFPDISAHSYAPGYYEVVIAGEVSRSGGTSAASPVVAGIIALLNDARLRAGKKSLGFLNPILYLFSSGFNNITEGASNGCTGVNLQSGEAVVGGGVIPGAHCKLFLHAAGTTKYAGFLTGNATPGWDPVTGLGTPNFAKLRDIVLALP